MPSPSDAEDHLRIIRSLMEKATIYRSLSAQAALVGGCLGVLGGGVFAGSNDIFVRLLAGMPRYASSAEVFGFELKWFIVAMLSLAVNFFFLYRDAQRRQDAFVSPGMRMAIRAMLPAFLCGAVVAALWPRSVLPQLWMVFYGLAILSTAHFAPTSLVRLGWAFLLTGLTLLVFELDLALHLREQIAIPIPGEKPASPGWTYPDALMAGTFGLYHLIYAACTLRQPRAAAALAPA